MISSLQQLAEHNPIALIAIIIVSAVTSSGGVTFVAGNMFATRNYVDSQISAIAQQIECSTAEAESRYVQQEVWELRLMQKYESQKFTQLHQQRLMEQEAVLVRLTAKLTTDCI